MKLPECRVFVACLVLVVFQEGAVPANPIETTLINYSIYQNNQIVQTSTLNPFTPNSPLKALSCSILKIFCGRCA